MQNKINKEDWAAMFREIGLSEDTMRAWHRLFETRHPEGHEAFLTWLGIDPGEIAKIRSGCK